MWGERTKERKANTRSSNPLKQKNEHVRGGQNLIKGNRRTAKRQEEQGNTTKTKHREDLSGWQKHKEAQKEPTLRAIIQKGATYTKERTT